jgi:hypothetical protein
MRNATSTVRERASERASERRQHSAQRAGHARRRRSTPRSACRSPSAATQHSRRRPCRTPQCRSGGGASSSRHPPPGVRRRGARRLCGRGVVEHRASSWCSVGRGRPQASKWGSTGVSRGWVSRVLGQGSAWRKPRQLRPPSRRCGGRAPLLQSLAGGGRLPARPHDRLSMLQKARARVHAAKRASCGNATVQTRIALLHAHLSGAATRRQGRSRKAGARNGIRGTCRQQCGAAERSAGAGVAETAATPAPSKAAAAAAHPALHRPRAAAPSAARRPNSSLTHQRKGQHAQQGHSHHDLLHVVVRCVGVEAVGVVRRPEDSGCGVLRDVRPKAACCRR